MVAETAKSLRERWDAAALAAVLGTGTARSPFGEHAGRVDLRGIDLLAAAGGIFIRRVVFEGVDLTFASLRGVWVEGCRFTGSSLDGTDAHNMTDHGNLFEGCTFSKTHWQGGGIGYDGTRFQGCLFEKSLFKGAGFIRPEFDDCTFDQCDFGGVDFSGSSFERCRFVGRLDDVWFRGGFPEIMLPSGLLRRKRNQMQANFGVPRPNRMLEVDLSGAELHWATFSDGCDLSSVVVPEDGRHVLFDDWGERLVALGAAARSLPERLQGPVEQFCKVYQVHAEKQRWYILNVDDLEAEWGVAARTILDGLDEHNGTPTRP
jgi:fluoroquinolone resistance protein